VPVGLIAQRVQQQAPYLVRAGNDAEGPFTEENMLQMWGVNETNLIATLIGAVKQLSARVRELEARQH
jgi:hypothetical protein